MKSLLLTAVGAAALTMGAPVGAQHTHMPGMQMPSPPKPAARKVPSKKKAVSRNKTPAPKKAPAPTTHPHRPAVKPPVDHSQMQHGSTSHPSQEQPPPPPPADVDHSQMDHSQMDHGAARSDADHQQHSAHSMSGALGRYPMTREASGTAWQPDNSEHAGAMTTSGDWTLMGHGVLNLVLNHQAGPRGDDKLFASGMLMGMARRQVDNGMLQFRASLSPDPLMGRSGYPLLLASGETANGEDRLIDRQHPHDLFMELSASLSQNIGSNSSAFVYAGLPGEPAFGPPAFMHREAIMDSPEAPISHHWLDSTHISFGVLTAGLVVDRVKVEVSRFNGREPDQRRYNIETGPLDSTAVRLSWNPTAELALQGSWGKFVDPEQLEPGVDQKRWSASLLYARDLAPGWKFAGTLAWGRKRIDHHGEALKDDAFAAEASMKHGPWTLFGRGEITENRELVALDEHGPAYRVGKLSLGAVRDFRIADHWSIGAGGLFAVNFVPDGLASAYGGHNPTGAMAFVRLKLH